MTTIIQHHLYGRITYDENFWTGKKNISINGVTLTKEGKNTYLYNDGQQQFAVSVKGSFLTGVKLIILDESIEITKPATWYEIACSVAVCVLIIVWGNNVALCSIVPIVGGAIGGAISGVMGVLNLYAMRSVKNVGIKLAIFAGMLVATFGICYVLALLLLAALATVA